MATPPNSADRPLPFPGGGAERGPSRTSVAPQPPVNRDEGQGTCQAGGTSSKHRPGGAGPPALHARLGTRTSHWAPPGPGGCEELGPSTPFHRAGHRHGLLHAKKLPLGGTSCLETTLGQQGRATAGLTLGRGRVSAGPGLPLSGDTEHPDRGWGGGGEQRPQHSVPLPCINPGRVPVAIFLCGPKEPHWVQARTRTSSGHGVPAPASPSAAAS